MKKRNFNQLITISLRKNLILKKEIISTLRGGIADEDEDGEDDNNSSPCSTMSLRKSCLAGCTKVTGASVQTINRTVNH